MHRAALKSVVSLISSMEGFTSSISRLKVVRRKQRSDVHHRDAQQHIREAFPPPRSIRQSNTSFRYFVEFNIPSKSQYVVIPETDRPIRHPIYTSAIQYWQYLASLQLQLEMKH
ncbi:hypothetical protein QL093DRAFT_1461255 [Fusarium oxysporum]|nr:hypothetical protein QL093DRAFT_1461255 [Fusarium oxysporum]